MNLQEAQDLIGYITEWQFLLMGVKERNDMPAMRDLSKVTLQQMLSANDMVKMENKRQRELANKLLPEIIDEEGTTTVKYKYTQQVILNDRIIAAVYTAINFPANNEMIALINDKGVGVVRAVYDGEDE